MTDRGVAWRGVARRLCWKVNIARSVDRAAVPAVCAAAVAAATVLVIRHYWPQAAQPWLCSAAIALPVAVATAAGLAVRRSFIGIDQAFIRLESQLGLHAALSTAHHGAGDWPPLPAVCPDGLRWRWGRTCIPGVLAAALVAAAWFTPVAARRTAHRSAEPAAWALVEADLQALIEKNLVDPTTTEETQRAIEALRERPQDEWFNHASIEAGDRILQAHQREMSDLQRRLSDAAQALRQAAKARRGLETHHPALNDRFGSLLSELGLGELAPDPALMQQLEQLRDALNAANPSLDPRQIAELLERLDANAQQLDALLEKFQNLPADCGQCGKCGKCQGKDGNAPPNGQPARGPGEGGRLFGDARDQVEASRNQPLPTGDLSQAAPGDQLGVGETTHDIDPSQSPALRAGGAPAAAGDGGAAVWSDTLVPSEQEALRRFFE